MNKKYAVAITLIITAGVGYFLLSTPTVNQNAHNHAPAVHNHEPADVPEDSVIVRNGQVLSTGVDKLQPKENDEQVAVGSFPTERDSIIWQESEQSKTVLQESGLIPSDVKNEAYVEVDLAELLTVEIGESLDLYIPQLGGSYNGEVDHIQQHPNGDRTVEAFIPGAGSLYSAVITIGDNAIYGNLATQEDVFILEGIGEYAWIAPKSAMIENHQERIPQPSENTGKDTNDTHVFEVD